MEILTELFLGLQNRKTVIVKSNRNLKILQKQSNYKFKHAKYIIH